MKKSTNITKKDLENVVGKLEKKLDSRIDRLEGKINGVEVSIRSDLKDFRTYTIQRFNKVDKRLDGVETELNGVKDRLGEVETGLGQVLETVLDLSDTDQHVHNLVQELKGQNIGLNEKRIFVA